MISHTYNTAMFEFELITGITHLLMIDNVLHLNIPMLILQALVVDRGTSKYQPTKLDSKVNL